VARKLSQEEKNEEYDMEWSEGQELADAVQKALDGINRVAFDYPDPVRSQIERLIDAKIALALWEKDHYSRR
jgi:hypothetical protein